ncbi:uncharacterized protein LOC111401458 [Olea europaea var. sylvestris]|uniref:uncharacterized protein LOC111401458 n=1 Tax=Olea europaea var. sylvestris TaxID=158386 RepID=UPI000C1D5ECD|nr:uncharacterized protein LOC111401458 [Olea europaea var. sylvestris]
MPKDRRVNSSSFDRARVSPYAGSSKICDPTKSDRYLPRVGDEAEWEEARCPICMDHPHNAVLLLCSSHDKGCRPYMCDTSSRHSNCLDQFRKSSSASSPAPFATPREDVSAPRVATRRHRGEQPLSRPINSLEGEKPVFVCPLCRGKITGWLSVECARRFMNSKLRSCSSENCNFSGNYSELRKHARLEHPSDRPAEADTQRQSEWMRLERQRDLEDALSAYLPDLDFDLGDLDELPSFDEWDGDGLWNDRNFFDFVGGLTEDGDEPSEDNNIFTDLEVEFSFSFLEYLSYPEIEATDSGTSISNDRVRNRRQINSRSSYPTENSLTGSRPRSNHHRENVPPSLRSSYYEGNTPASSRPTYLGRYAPTRARSRSGYHRANRSPVRSSTSGRQMPGSSQWHQSSRRS